MNLAVGKDCIMWGDAPCYAGSGGGVGDAYGMASLFEAHLLSLNHDTDRIPSVSGLMREWKPKAVFWRIPKLYISMLYGVARRRLRSHICKEVPEIFPSITYRDSSRAIIFVVLIVGIRTALPDALPALVFWGLGVPRGAVLEKSFASIASAASCRTISEAPREDKVFGSTIAEAFINDGAMARSAMVRKHNEASVPNAYLAVEDSHG